MLIAPIITRKTLAFWWFGCNIFCLSLHEKNEPVENVRRQQSTQIRWCIKIAGKRKQTNTWKICILLLVALVSQAAWRRRRCSAAAWCCCTWQRLQPLQAASARPRSQRKQHVLRKCIAPLLETRWPLPDWGSKARHTAQVVGKLLHSLKPEPYILNPKP